MRQRELTPHEQRALNLCKRFEEALELRKLTVSLWANETAVKAMNRLETEQQHFRILAYSYDSKRQEYRVTWTLAEFNRYLFWVLSLVGMKLMIDGSLRTKDGLTVTNEYLS